MKRTIKTSLTAAACALALGIAGPAFAQKEGKKSGTNLNKAAPASSPASEAVSIAAMAERLALYGEEKKDPVALIAAARIKQDIGATTTEREKESRGGKGDATKPAKVDTNVEALLNKAKSLAAGRQDIVALADEVGKGGTRGAVRGPQVANTVVRSNSTDIFRIAFRGGEPAAVFISGDGDSDLDLWIYDENGNLICRANSRRDDEGCRWNPRWTGPFRIEVRNLGVANRYQLWTN
jgi:hypothetical protein